MKSNVSLEIEIDHEDNLDLNASEIAGEVARHLASRLGLSPGALYVVDGRRHITGPVEVFLRSAAITTRTVRPEVAAAFPASGVEDRPR